MNSSRLPRGQANDLTLAKTVSQGRILVCRVVERLTGEDRSVLFVDLNRIMDKIETDLNF